MSKPGRRTKVLCPGVLRQSRGTVKKVELNSKASCEAQIIKKRERGNGRRVE